METANYSTLNVGQLHILEMLNRCKTEGSLDALKRALCEFYAAEAEKEMNRLWDEGVVSEDTIDEWGKTHMRTPYIHAK